VMSGRGLCNGLIPQSREVLPSVCVCHWVWSVATITLCT